MKDSVESRDSNLPERVYLTDRPTESSSPSSGDDAEVVVRSRARLLLFLMLERIPWIVAAEGGEAGKPWERGGGGRAKKERERGRGRVGGRNKMERMSDVEPGADLRGAL